jgi:hypothetical protein
MEQINPQPIMRPVESVKTNKMWMYIVGAFLVVVLGVGGAWLISSKVINKGPVAAPGAKVTSTEAGILDPKIKYDNATGVIKNGGTGNEGTHHLDREGGVSQTVYLTSSVIDLSSFDGKKVQVWGQTLASKKAGWLMDVAKVQVVQ